MRAEISALESQSRWLIRVSICVLVLGAGIATWAIFWFALTPDDLDRLGSFLSGTVVGMWSLAGVLLVYVAFLGQRRQILNQEEEIRLNRLELKATRKELAGQRVQLELQNSIFRAQSFESTFFHLMSLHHQIVAAIAVERNHGSKVGVFRGRDAFAEFYREFKLNYTPSETGPQSAEEREAINSCYRVHYTIHQAEFGHYFRNLYRMIKLIDQANLDDRAQYAGFARAQLSSYELACLFYNCLSAEGSEKFKPLIEKYTLLKNLAHELLLHEKHASHYSLGAFGKPA
ncbi:MAG TPA: putative phage abortive infection protein [Longimicrobium sp.]|nr:putative phage abortive infection protein [Longimicrobium sp.]